MRRKPLSCQTNRPMVRKDMPDLVYLTAEDKYQAIIKDIEATRNAARPVLVGTASIESSEYLSNLLHQAKIPHQVLNAKFHANEAQIIAEAGRPGAVTIATNMAGRGTDIVLGGNWQSEVAKLSEPTEAQLEAIKRQSGNSGMMQLSLPVVYISLVLNGMNRAGLTTSYAVGQAGRAMPVRAGFIWRWTMR